MRALLKSIFCQTVFRTGLLQFYIRAVFFRRKAFPAVIINYHSFVKDYDNIIDTEPTVTHLIEDFKKELAFICRYFHVAPLDEVIDTLARGGKFRKPTVAITIDDGFKNNFDALFPVLKERKVAATIFLAAGFIGTDQRIWVDRLAQIIQNTHKQSLELNGVFKNQKYPLLSIDEKRQTYADILQKLKKLDINRRENYLKEIEFQLGRPQKNGAVMLDWEQVRIMSRHNISFGAHTCRHPILTKMPLEDAKKEIMDSKAVIERELNKTVRHFAYPNGQPRDFNEELRSFCKAIGFQSIHTTEFGSNHNSADVWAMKRMGSYTPLSLFAVNTVRAFLK